MNPTVQNSGSPQPSAPGRRWEASDFVEFFTQTGRRPILGLEHLWYPSFPGCFQSFPYHRVVEHPRDELRRIFEDRRCLAVRFPTSEEDRSAGVTRDELHLDTGVLFVRRRPYSINDLSRNTRSRVRRGLKACTVERVEPGSLARAAQPLVASTAGRQGTGWVRLQVRRWERFCQSAQRHRAFEAWAARVQGQLAAVAVCFTVEECYQVSSVRSDAAHLGSYPNNALMHTILESVSNRAEITQVCYGLGSLDRRTVGLHDFKLSMGFEAQPVRDNIVSRYPLRIPPQLISLMTSPQRPHRLAQLGTAASQLVSLRRFLST